MEWVRRYLPEAVDDLKHLDGSVKKRVLKALDKICTKPQPADGSNPGYGKPLGNRGGTDLTGLLKVKLKNDGVRIVYKLVECDNIMLVVIIGMRTDDEVYREAVRRKRNHNL